MKQERASEQAQALAGVRILDLTDGPAGGMATMVLADFGAEVLMVERPAGSVPNPLSKLPAAPMWRRGKHSLKLDLNTDEGLYRLHELAACADAFIINWRSGALQRKGLDFNTLHARHPHLVYCHITGFGSRGPMAEIPGYEHLVAAYSGRMQTFAGITDRQGPVFSAVQVGVHACAQSAAAGILAALLERGDDGYGRLVETSLLQGMLPYEMGPMLGIQFEERFADLLSSMQTPRSEPPMPSLFYHPAQAGDGRWMQFGNLLPHLFDNFLMATELIDIIADPDFDPKQLLIRDREKHEAFRERMLKRIQELPAADWMLHLIADGGVVAAVYQTTQEALQDPDIQANGHVIQRPSGGVQLGPLARLTQTPAKPGGDALADSALADEWIASPRQRTQPRPDKPADRNGLRPLPLTGVKVVEMATIIAAPIGASFLADMGADVIKIEQIGGDPFRGMLSGLGSARVNVGKRSISVDMKTRAGREIVLKLLGDADVVIHNYRPGVPERLGVGYEQIAAFNPGIVYLQCNGYGPDGPGAMRPSTHPIPGAAMGGVMYQMGGSLPAELQDFEGLKLWTRRLMRANELNPDPNTGLVVATAALLGLAARQRTGRGQQIFTDMFGANAYANADDFLNYPGKPHRQLPDTGLHGLSPTYRLYRCAGEEWVFLAIVTAAEQQAFIDTLAAADLALLSLEKLQQGSDHLAATLERMFVTRDAGAWESLLSPAGIGCLRADGPSPAAFWLANEQAAAMEMTSTVEHPSWGEYQRHGALVNFDGCSQPLLPPPEAGQHNSELLRSLGYSAEKIEHLQAERVLWQG